MTLEELNIKLENVNKDLQSNAYGNVMVQVANDALYLIKDRVVNKGIDSDNKKMKAYSQNPLKMSKGQMSAAAYNKIAGSKAKRAQLSWVVSDGKRFFVLPYGYTQFRQLHGRQTKHVDYTFSGRMWNNIQLRKDRSDLNGGVAVIGASTPEDRNKISRQIELRGIFLRPTKSDIKILTQTFSNGILEIFKKNGL